MWKRRVGVTAFLWWIDRSRVTGSSQVARQMAAPLDFRTPMGTAAISCNKSADGSMAIKALESTGRGQSRQQSKARGRRKCRGIQGGLQSLQSSDGALKARMRRSLILRQGASPLRPQAPFPWSFIFRKGGNLSRVRKPRRRRRRALDKFPPFRRDLRDKGKGAIRDRLWFASRWSALKGRNQIRP